MIRTYLSQVRRISCADIERRQAAPWAALPYGATGLALALLRLTPKAALLENREHLDGLLREIPERPRSRAYIPVGGSYHHLRHSFVCGPNGLRLVRLLLACKRGEEPDGAELRRLLRASLGARTGPWEYMLGAAGHVMGLISLWQETSDEPTIAAATLLAETLLERGRGPKGWCRERMLGFAHGRSGAFHALLTWSAATGTPLPPWFFDELARMASDTGDLSARAMGFDGNLELTWCNGLAGLTLMWVRAYEYSASRGHLREAKRTARALLSRTDVPVGDLCCGLGGGAFALLALDRVDPDQGWYEEAIRLASRGVDALLTNAPAWPNGLFRGFPGVALLVRDLQRPPARRRGFPLVEDRRIRRFT